MLKRFPFLAAGLTLFSLVAGLVPVLPARAALPPPSGPSVFPPLMDSRTSPYAADAWSHAQQLAEKQAQSNVQSLPLQATADVQAVVPLGHLYALVLLVDFTDLHAVRPNWDEKNLFFGDAQEAPNGSVYQVYQENSYQKFDFDGSVFGDPRASAADNPDPTKIVRWIHLPHDYSWYANGSFGFGPGPQNVQTLVNDALTSLKNLYPDFDWSLFDQNGDGFVDIMYIVHAGAGAETTVDPNDLWSHQSEIPDFTLQDTSPSGLPIKVRHYAFSSEESQAGTHAHEIGHIFGLPDLYTYPQLLGNGIGDWSIMASGVWLASESGGVPFSLADSRPGEFDPWSKIQLGWLSPTVLTKDTTGITLPPVETNPVVLKIPANPNTPLEYFLVENRAQLQGTFDAPALLTFGDDPGNLQGVVGGGLPGSGIMIYHVDESRGSNDDRGHLLVKVMEADAGDPDPNTGQPSGENLQLPYYHPNANRGDEGDPFGNSHAGFSQVTVPNSLNYSGKDSGVRILKMVAPPLVPADLDLDGNPDFLVVSRDNANATLDVLVISVAGSVYAPLLGSLPSYTVQLLDASGQPVPNLKPRAIGNQFSYSGLPSGNYFIQITADKAIPELIPFTKTGDVAVGNIFLIPQTSLTLSKGWNLVSMPLVYNNLHVSDVFGIPNLVSFAWNGTSYDANPIVKTGESYWVYVQDPTQIKVVAAGVPISITQDVPVLLRKGWNLIGNPYPRGITWDPTTFHVKTATGTLLTLEEAKAQGFAESSGWLYRPTRNDYRFLKRGDAIFLGQGFWYYSYTDGNTMVFPGVAPTAG
jgi:immune inhibitor A